MTTPGPTTPNSPSGIAGIGGVSSVEPTDEPTVTAGTETVSLAVGQKKAWSPRPNEVLSPEQKELDELTDDELEALTEQSVSTGVLGGAAAVVSAALGLVSISGTFLSTVIQQRQGVIGQLAGKTTADVLKASYNTAWHRMAEWNGLFALVAVLVGAVTVFGATFLSSKQVPGWVRAVAWAGIVLGLVGLFISGAIYFDWFMPQLKAPAATGTTG
ncbi:hypothetical protein [Streptacidiphilus rugosus]|uniref:hypothetical protein n=1 Tax=Streptacidiphilus rugosus TaxID=405783 RepID=UPI00068D0F2A|nr:hypothetical protein [Streptacidiphilus rugosus]